MKKFILFIMLLCYAALSYAQQGVKGTIISLSDHTPLPGATIKIKGTNISTTSDSSGQFHVVANSNKIVLLISYIGFKTTDIAITLPLSPLTIPLKPDPYQLNEVMVSTGYQDISKERATGSFVKVDNNLLNRSVSTDILSRLQNVTSGLIFNKGKGTIKNDISIRGLSTIFGNAQPLIVVDNFPYDGDINDINPNDVESITVLKDAAAASIWGARAGNGVIVITTKKGKYNQSVHISFNSNITIGDKPNLFYQSRMSSADYIETEKKLFAQGYYQNTELSYNNLPLTPVVELLIAERDGKITSEAANAQINALKIQDVRNGLEKYFYRKNVNQQYSLNINGGSENQRYYISGGYDKNLDNLVGNEYDRVTLNANNTYNWLKNKLEFTTGVYITQSSTTANNPGIDQITYDGNTLYPYASLADNNGNPLAITKDYRAGFIQTAAQGGLLDWTYKPLQEVRNADNTSKITDYRLNTSLKYNVLPGLSAQVLYQYERSSTDGRNLQSQDTYYTRNLINQYTQINADGSLTLAIPAGGILDSRNVISVSNDIRGQLNYNLTWSQKNELTAIGGYEVRGLHTTGAGNRLYGYDDTHATSGLVNYTDYYIMYNNPYDYRIVPNTDYTTDLHDNYRSWYFNGAYTYDRRYTLSGSIRRDESNLFGVKTNQKGVPLYSAGLSWSINNEGFCKSDWLPLLKLRATYGYNGNVNKTVTAYTTALYWAASQSAINQPYAQITNPPNPELRWEKVQVINLGVDFGIRNNTITGTIEYYHKKGNDLIGTIPYAPSTGITTFTGNTANTSGNGMDLTLNTKNIDRQFKWNTTFLLSLIQDKVTKYLTPFPAAYLLQYGDGLGKIPVEGRPLYALFSYKWAGLDHQTGNPQGYLNGDISTDYSAIISSATPGNLVYNGSARPTIFGSFRNSFAYKNISISANISYNLGYYFRKNSIGYGNNYGLGGNGDYYKRWQKPGDEANTYVPSMPTTVIANRDLFYNFSSVLVEKADNIRLQDVNISYVFNGQQLKKLPFRNVQFYLYANNLALLWKANKSGVDPDYQTGPVPKTIALGLKADF
ncbi:SusC/RagA family TonB-linked outer membrane protein [Mucilaginibacter sp. ZT4R22]|uniref:SusC/RagA family TonB-linked outer membrane protein n=1 Tax=Mucilaginibacter pankratovii TaxID=2772110 RepID=A0ABR7WYA7_9SPHI|nr:SusC/RagA family TonB-linked outer membrane protein [Mucilaginibacter pankratovii]MBD1366577.1 SusC/RagA family TonB-linked outer membrane protein [Mucilaginibacter pankratovii]